MKEKVISKESQAELEQQINKGFANLAESPITQSSSDLYKQIYELNKHFVEYATNARLLTDSPRSMNNLGGY